jgi:Holliday junction resolvase
MVNSKQKGARFERLLAAKLREFGFNCRRGQQYCGANSDADVVGLPNIHIEAKHVEHLNIFDAIAQANRDKKENEIAAVFHKKNNTDILVTMSLDDFMKIYKDSEYSEVKRID